VSGTGVRFLRLARQINSSQRGITGLETAIVLIAFVVVSSVFAFAALSTGLFASDKSKETLRAGLSEARGSLEVSGSVVGSATLTTVSGEVVGSGDGSATGFSMDNNPIIPGTETVRVDGTAKTYGPDFVMNFDNGTTTFSTAPANGLSVTADYTYYKINNVKITLVNAAGGRPVDLTAGETVVTYLDKDTVASNITNFTLTPQANADSDNLLERNEMIEMSVDVSTYGLSDGGQFTIQIKPASGTVITVQRWVPANIGTVIDLG
jgi:flagellin FlaB